MLLKVRKEVSPKAYLQSLSDGDFEQFIRKYLIQQESLDPKYVTCYGGGADQGRDVEIKLLKRHEIYQCKKYGGSLAPSDIWSEIGKVLYYTACNVYNMPSRFGIVGAAGCGPKLKDLLGNAKKLEESLTDNWRKVTLKLPPNKADYDTQMRANVPKLCQRVFELNIDTVIDQLSGTEVGLSYFGSGYEPRRIIPAVFEEEDQLEEYFESSIRPILEREAARNGDQFDVEEINRMRICYYTARSLRDFSVTSYALAGNNPFEELMQDVISIAKSEKKICIDDREYIRMIRQIKSVVQYQYDDNILIATKVVSLKDKEGLLHIPVHETKHTW